MHVCKYVHNLLKYWIVVIYLRNDFVKFNLNEFFCSYVSVIIKATKLKQHPGASKKRNGYRQICERHTVNSARQNE